MSVTDCVRANAVPMAYRLFSQMKITGSFHRAAMFSDSWKTPWAADPSPKKHRQT